MGHLVEDLDEGRLVEFALCNKIGCWCWPSQWNGLASWIQIFQVNLSGQVRILPPYLRKWRKVQAAYFAAVVSTVDNTNVVHCVWNLSDVFLLVTEHFKIKWSHLSGQPMWGAELLLHSCWCYHQVWYETRMKCNDFHDWRDNRAQYGCANITEA